MHTLSRIRPRSQSEKGSHYSDFLFGKIGAFLVIAFVLLWLYGDSLNLYFFLDDFRTMEESRIASVSDFVESFNPVHYGAYPGGRAPIYRPLSTFIYFSAMQALAGFNPFYFRVVNLVLLGLISLMIYEVILALSENRMTAFSGSVLYSLNAAHALTQLWISCASELMSTLLATISFYAYLLWTRRGKSRYYAISLLAFVLGLISKEMSIVVPGFLFLFEILYVRPLERKELRPLVRRLFPFFVIGCAYVVFWLYFLGSTAGPYRISIGLFVLTNLFRYLSWAVNTYLVGLLGVSPTDSLAHGYAASESPWWLISLKLLVVISVLLYLSVKNTWQVKKEVLFSLGWFVIGLLPILFAPGRLQHYYLLLPNVGLAVMLGTFATKMGETLASRGKFLAAVLGAAFIMAALAYSTSAIRKEEALLRVVTARMRNVESQLRQKMPNPPDYSGFVFSGDYGGGWWRELSLAMRVVYGNPTLNATSAKDGSLPEKVASYSGPVYLVHVQDGVVNITQVK